MFGHEISGFSGLFIFITARIPELAGELETVGFGFGTDKHDGLHHGDPVFGELRNRIHVQLDQKDEQKSDFFDQIESILNRIWRTQE